MSSSGRTLRFPRVTIVAAVVAALFASGITVVIAAPQDVVTSFDLVPMAGEATTKVSGDSFGVNWRVTTNASNTQTIPSPVVTMTIANPHGCVAEVRPSPADKDHTPSVTTADGGYRITWAMNDFSGGQSYEVPVIIRTVSGRCGNQERIPVTATMTDSSGTAMQANNGQPMQLTVTTEPLVLSYTLPDVWSGADAYGGASTDGGAHLTTTRADLNPVRFALSVSPTRDTMGVPNCRNYTFTETLEQGALFDPALNPGWTLNQDNRTVSMTTAERMYHSLLLLFPGEATGQPRTSTATVTCNLADPIAGEQNPTTTASVQYRLTSVPREPSIYQALILNSKPPEVDNQRFRDSDFNYTMAIHNLGGSPMSYTLTDYTAGSTTQHPRAVPGRALDSRLYFSQVRLNSGAMVAPGQIDVMVCRNSEPPTLVRTVTIGANGNATVDLPDGQSITCLQLKNHEGEAMPHDSLLNIIVATKFRAPKTPITTGSNTVQLCNAVYLDATYVNGRPGPSGEDARASNCTMVGPLRTVISSEKTVPPSTHGTNHFLVGDIVNWELRPRWETNGGNADLGLTGLTMIDLLPPGFQFVPAESSATTGQRNPDRVVDNYHNSGRQALIWDNTVTDQRSDSLFQMQPISARVTSSAQPGENTNRLYVIPKGETTAILNESQLVTDQYDLNDNGSTTDRVLEASHVVTYLPPKVLLTHKLVQGSQDTAPVRAPATGTTSYNEGSVTYTLMFRNDSVQNIANLTVIDVLPDVGDHTIAPTTMGQVLPRNSQFPVRLTGPITLPAGREGDFTIMYTTFVVGTRTAEQINTEAEWSMGVPTDTSMVTAFKIVMNPGRVISTGSEVKFTVPAMVASTDPAHAGQTANNSYATSVRADGAGFFESDIVGVKAIDPNSRLVTTKAVSPPDGTPVKAGDTLTYAVILDNSKGAAPAPVNLTGNLTDVHDDAIVDHSSLTVTDPEVRAGFSTPTGNLNLEGLVPAGQTTTVRYTATVKVDGQRGNDSVQNCLGTQCTTNPIQRADTAQFTATKSAAPPTGNSVSAGQQVAYTLTLNNATGTTAVPVNLTDDMSGVIDDANYVANSMRISNPAVTGTWSADNRTLTLGGNVPAGQTVTVTYNVTVKQTGPFGDNVMRNCLGTQCTTHSVAYQDSPQMTIAKSADPPSRTRLTPGQQVTFTLTFDNTRGTVPGAAILSDTIEGLVDDMTLDPASLTSSMPSVRAILEGNIIRTEGGVPPGQRATVSYRATVKPDGQRGDNFVVNCIVPVLGPARIGLDTLPGGEPLAEAGPTVPIRPLSETTNACTMHPIGPSRLVTSKTANCTSCTGY